MVIGNWNNPVLLTSLITNHHLPITNHQSTENIMETTTIAVKGMTCMGCVASVKRVLDGIPGITRAEVSLQPGQAAVSYDATKTSVQSIKSAITDAGYEVA